MTVAHDSTADIILFKHRASCMSGKKSPSIDGELIVSTLQISFKPLNSSNDNDTIRYSKSVINGRYGFSPEKDEKVKFLIDLSTNAENKVIITFILIGNDRKQLRMELERLRSIARSDKQPNTTTNTTAANNSKTQKLLNKNATELTRKLAIQDRRNALLDADKNLYNKYKDLVLTNKLISEDEFWYDNDRISQDDVNIQANIKKGKVTNLLSDMVKFGQNVVSFTMTKEMRQEIFQMYPAILLAYNDKVPVSMTEIEFWDAFIKSDYYCQDKGATAASRAMKTDDMFKKYDKGITTTTAAAIVMDSRKSLQGIFNATDVQKLVHSAVPNLTNIDDDRPSSLISIDKSYNADGFELNVKSQYSSNIITKYNRHSHLFFSKPDNANDDDDSDDNIGDIDSNADELHELQMQTPDEYVELNLTSQYHKIRHHTDINGQAGAVPEEEEYSAFKKAKTITKTIGRKALPLQSAADISAKISSVFPTSDRAMKLVREDIKRKRRFTAVAKYAAATGSASIPGNTTVAVTDNTVLGSLNSSSSSGGGNGKRSRWSVTDMVEGKELSDEFKFQMLDVFNLTTELLRHLYSCIIRDDDVDAVIGINSNSPNVIKGNKIVERLKSSNEQLLQTRKNVVDCKYSVACIDEIVKLIRRGMVRWDQFAIKFAL